MNKKFVFIILLLIFSGKKALAQKDTIKDISYYLDDGGISTNRDIIKVNIPSIITGDLPFFYERVLSRSIGIEAGVGILLPYYVPEIPITFISDVSVKNTDGGYSLYLQPKYYFTHRAPEDIYIGMQVRRRTYFEDKISTVFTDLILNFGSQAHIKKNLIIDVSYGVGFRIITDAEENLHNTIDGIVMPVAVKLGYSF
ncbi:MAG: hypothetical protein H7259_07170 [Cytophagales bacterium]|nr:hypothetical protein [Cytophaga sp.]